MVIVGQTLSYTIQNYNKTFLLVCSQSQGLSIIVLAGILEILFILLGLQFPKTTLNHKFGPHIHFVTFQVSRCLLFFLLKSQLYLHQLLFQLAVDFWGIYNKTHFIYSYVFPIVGKTF